MRRLKVFAISTIGGGVVTGLLLAAGLVPPETEYKPLYEASDLERRNDEALSAGTAVPMQLAISNAAADIDNPAELEARLTQLLAEPFSRERRAEIEALFARLAAIDLRRAMRFAASAGFDRSLVADAFRAAAERAAAAALAELGAIGDRTVRGVAALGLAEALGGDADSIERIAAMLPEDERVAFQADALAELAKTDVRAALNQALSLVDPAARNSAAQRVGAVWTHDDPQAALTYVGTLPPELQNAYRDTVSTEWARLDPHGFLQFLQGERQLQPLLLGLGHVLAYDPVGVFELAISRPRVQFYALGTLETISFEVVSQVDPDYARRYVDSLGNDPRGQQLLTVFAETYGRTKPDEALSWVRGLNPPRPDLEASVIAETAVFDIDRALRLMREFASRDSSPASVANRALGETIANRIGSIASNHPRREEIANILLARSNDDPIASSTLRRLTTQWVQIDPASALDWMLANEGALDVTLVGSIGGQLAARDARTAAKYLEAMPNDNLRRLWMEQVAAPYARQDPFAAASWIERFQGVPGYDNVLGQVVAQSAQSDPQGASMLLNVAPPEVQRRAASSIASAWAQQDLFAAADWAAQVSDPDARRAALAAVGGRWAARDPVTAQRWAAALPRGEARQPVLSSVLGQVLQAGGEIDGAFAAAFESSEAWERAFVGQLTSIALRDPERADSLLRRWVRDPELLARGEQMLTQGRQRFGL